MYSNFFIRYLYKSNEQKNKDMITQEIKTKIKEMAGIYNRNLSVIKRQLSRQELASLHKEYSTDCDNHLAKKLMLRGIKLY